MTLPSSGIITLNEIKKEFGGPINLRAYYNGGSYVPPTATNAAIPSSGIITIKDFYGTSNSCANLTSVSAEQISSNPAANAAVSYILNSNGVAQVQGVVGTTVEYTNNIPSNWLLLGYPNSVASDYQVYASLISETLIGGSIFTGVLNTWINLSSSVNWYVTSQHPGPSQAYVTLEIQIREISTLSVVASCVVSIRASCVNGGGDTN